MVMSNALHAEVETLNNNISYSQVKAPCCARNASGEADGDSAECLLLLET